VIEIANSQHHVNNHLRFARALSHAILSRVHTFGPFRIGALCLLELAPLGPGGLGASVTEEAGFLLVLLAPAVRWAEAHAAWRALILVVVVHVAPALRRVGAAFSAPVAPGSAADAANHELRIGLLAVDEGILTVEIDGEILALRAPVLAQLGVLLRQLQQGTAE